MLFNKQQDVIDAAMAFRRARVELASRILDVKTLPIVACPKLAAVDPARLSAEVDIEFRASPYRSEPSNEFLFRLKLNLDGKQIGHLFGRMNLEDEKGISETRFIAPDEWKKSGLSTELLRRVAYVLYKEGFDYISTASVRPKIIGSLEKIGFKFGEGQVGRLDMRRPEELRAAFAAMQLPFQP